MLTATLRDVITSASLDALAVLLPVDCAGCGRPDRALCAECRAGLRGAPIRRSLERPDGGRLAVVAALPYDGVVRRSILALKQQGRTDLVRALAAPLASAIDTALTSPELPQGVAGSIRLCAVPQGATSQRERGYDPVRLLARRASGVPVGRMLHHDAGRAQKQLGVEQRHANIAGTMRSRSPLDGARVLLVDDVVTSGATLLEADRAVRDAGGRVLGAAVLAATPLRSTTHADSS